ncbi:MAG: TetR/AcrR family transcriptional regulator [Rhodobacteraceae bacterium]|nr:TetR/AcrR family transcriptional regulator [Paracoccaceae bacterium]
MAAKDHRDSKSAIFHAAQTVFVENDGAFEMNHVAQRAGVSVGLAYHYFGSKAGLVSAIIAEFYDRYDAVANQLFPKGMPWREREHLRLLHTVEFLFQDPMAPLMLGRLGGDAKVMGVEAARREAIIELAVVNISKAQDRGEIPLHIDPAIAAAVINGGFREAVAMVLREPERIEPAQFADQLWRLIVGALGLPAPHSAE